MSKLTFLAAVTLILPQFAVALAPAAPRSSRDPVGAAYFINNDLDKNVIMVHDILSDGTVRFAKGVSTGGKGGHGIAAPAIPTPSGTDQLFSQGSVTVDRNRLFAVNPGSNTLSMFAINPEDPKELTQIASPVDTNGEFPVSVGVSPTTGQVCVLNSGKLNGVSCFTQDIVHGLRTIPETTRMVAVVNASTPPSNGPFNSVSQVLFSEDGQNLLVPVKGDHTNVGYMAKWKVSPSGTLSSTYTRTYNNLTSLPFSITRIPGANAYLNTSPGIGNSFSVYDYTRGDVAVATGYRVNGSKTMCWSTHNPSTGSYFIVDSGNSTIRELTLDKSFEPTILQVTLFPSGSGTIDSDVAVIGKKSYLYNLASAYTSINVVDVSVPGKAVQIQSYNFSTQASVQHVAAPISAQGMATFMKSR